MVSKTEGENLSAIGAALSIYRLCKVYDMHPWSGKTIQVRLILQHVPSRIDIGGFVQYLTGPFQTDKIFTKLTAKFKGYLS